HTAIANGIAGGTKGSDVEIVHLRCAVWHRGNRIWLSHQACGVLVNVCGFRRAVLCTRHVDAAPLPRYADADLARTRSELDRVGGNNRYRGNCAVRLGRGYKGIRP